MLTAPVVSETGTGISRRVGSDWLPTVDLKSPHKAPKDQSNGGTAGAKAPLQLWWC